MCAEKQKIYINFIVFVLILPGLEPTIYRTYFYI
jgi:hypothetical protein